MSPPTPPKTLYPFYIFPPSPSPSSSSRIQSKISVNIKTLLHPVTLPNITKIIRTIIPTNLIKMLLSLLDSIDITAFVDGFIVPCLKSLTELVKWRPRTRPYVMVRRFRLSFSRKFKLWGKRSNSSSYFRFHYNWSSRSFVFSVPVGKGGGSIANSDLDEECNEDSHDSRLDGYLEWLEQRGQVRESSSKHDSWSMSDVDVLAEEFIQHKYEMFVLEKQESERMFQEMMARSL